MVRLSFPRDRIQLVAKLATREVEEEPSFILSWGCNVSELKYAQDEWDPVPPTPTTAGLSIQTKGLRLSTMSEPPPDSPPLPPLPAVSTLLRPTHLKMNHFGSRFLPHSTVPIRCLLPLLSDRLLLVGHDEGLSVLDMYPQDWNETGGIDLKGPEDAKARVIWHGESVYQMSILEGDNTSGVVLMLVGPEPESPLMKEAEGQRAIRMYNLASLISLGKWAVANKGAHPLNLGGYGTQQTTPKKHRPTSSIARGFKALIPPTYTPDQGPQSYQTLLTPTPSVASVRPPAHRGTSDESSWEMVDDLPLRWARDFVPLASAGSRLLNASILSFALWNKDDGERHGSRGQFLAVATKNNILLYETPQNERAFRFLKEFYTPLPPKTICFFQQTVHEMARSPTDVDSRHRRSGSNTMTPRSGGARSSSIAAPKTTNYGTQLSIFVIFEKKAGWIRLADSAVGEIELFEDAGLAPGAAHMRTASSTSPSSVRRRHVSSGIDGAGGGHGHGHGHGHGRWLPPVRCELPTGSAYLLTRGLTTHVVPCPLPSHAASMPPLAALAWRAPPAHVAPRVGDVVLQLTALGTGSVEVQELPLAGLGAGGGEAGKGKGKARAEDPGPVRAEEDAGGETGFLCAGGHWDHAHNGYQMRGGGAGLQRTYSTASDMSSLSFESMESQEVAEKLRREQGIYGWCRKGLADWRVFWLGGSFVEGEE
ncbi:hypothetical protein B0H17DRAFT_70382 [Mycena rosella]|uniref:Uncharacterized protein n=1 Tax=Mycena rosella TaxID=1033263 RepID=A0AAD7GDE7_MYCRO|nr:hypothetical protein B0H17DRAFT_70382 [Mycena rosella]